MITATEREKVKFEGGRSHIVYKTRDGKRVPGTTTVAKLGDSAEALIAWAWKLGTEGLDYRKARESAADSGTVAHFMVLCHLQGKEADLSDLARPIVDRAETAFLHFLDFWNSEKLTPVAQEIPLVSEVHHYGGTLDIVAKAEDGSLVLLDWKTASAIYQSALAQVAAYETLWNEYHPDQPIARRAVVRIPKEDVNDFEVRWLSSVDRYWELFRCQLALYNAAKKCKGDTE